MLKSPMMSYPSVASGESSHFLETLRLREKLMRDTSGAIKTLARPKPAMRAAEFAFFVPLAAVGVSLTVRSHSVLALAAGIFLTALAINAFVILQHDGMHGTLLRNRRANWLVSALLAASFLMSFTAYRTMHLRHHRYLGDPRDPDEYHNYTHNVALVWLMQFVRLFFGSPIYAVLIPILALRHATRAERRSIALEYAIVLVLWGTLLYTLPMRTLFFAWIAPLLLMGVFTVVRGIAEHGFTIPSDPVVSSRTMVPNPVVSFLMLNINYHLEHHLFPEIPSYHLPRMHRLIWPRIPRAIEGRSYLGFLSAFLRAAPKMDESPIGLVHPGAEN